METGCMSRDQKLRKSAKYTQQIRCMPTIFNRRQQKIYF